MSFPNQSPNLSTYVKSTRGDENTISTMVAVFSVVSVTIGAGMVAVPKASYESGIPWAISYNIFNLVACVYSIHLYMR